MNRWKRNFFTHGFYGPCQFVLGAIFIYAATLKIAAPQEFADNIAAYHLVPNSIIGPMALGLPLFELACGVFLVTGYFCMTGLLSIIGLLVLFAVAVLFAVVRGLPIECGCFGVQSWFDASPLAALLRDGALLAGAVYTYRHRLALESERQHRAKGAHA
jgi:putative oxidoreductase